MLRMFATNAPRISTEVRVMFFDTDCGGVLHNIAYLRFIEISTLRSSAPAGTATVPFNTRGALWRA